MNYRVINTAIHQDEWFRSLTINQKNIWFYLLSAPESNLSGIYQIDLQYMELNTGISLAEIRATFEKFQKDDRLAFKNKYVIIIKFLSHQQLNTNQIKRVCRIITEEIPAEVREYIRKLEPFKATINGLDKYETLQEWLKNGSKALRNGSKALHKDNDKEKEKKQEKEKEQEKKKEKKQAAIHGDESPAAAAASGAFEDLEKKYDFLKTLQAEGMSPKTIMTLIDKYTINRLFMVYQHIYDRPADNWVGLFVTLVKSGDKIHVSDEARATAKIYKLEI